MWRLGLVTAAAVAVVATGDRSVPPRYPSHWDPRVAELAAWVARARQLSFEHPVFVDFVSPKEYSARVRVDPGPSTAVSRRHTREGNAAMVAAGLLYPGTDLTTTATHLLDTGTAAYYDAGTERITVRTGGGPLATRSVLAHELTHVLQDQHFGHRMAMARELSEGDADRIRQQWLRTLDADDLTHLQREVSRSGAGRRQAAADPGPMVAEFNAPYVLGLPLVDLLVRDGGNTAVDAAFGGPMLTGEQGLNPLAFRDHDRARRVAPPSIPRGAKRIPVLKPGRFGPVALFSILSDRLDVGTSLTAVDGWGGDNARTYRRGNRACFGYRVVGDTPLDTRQLQDALVAWAKAGPDSVVVSVSQVAGAVTMESCAPLTVAAEPAPPPRAHGAVDAMRIAGLRIDLVDRGIHQSRERWTRSFGFADCVVHAVPEGDLLAAMDGTRLPPADGRLVSRCDKRELGAGP